MSDQALGPLSGAAKYPAGARPSKCIIIIMSDPMGTTPFLRWVFGVDQCGIFRADLGDFSGCGLHQGGFFGVDQAPFHEISEHDFLKYVNLWRWTRLLQPPIFREAGFLLPICSCLQYSRYPRRSLFRPVTVPFFDHSIVSSHHF
jgi:hypothetical protein